MGNTNSLTPHQTESENIPSKNIKADTHVSFKAPILFEQLPHEINLIILNLLDVETLLKTSRACKRWMNNTKCVEHLSLWLTNKRIREFVGDHRFQKVPRTRLAKINWQPMEATLKRFNPEHLRSLQLQPDLQQENSIVDAFVSRCTNLTKLSLCSYWYMDAVLKLPAERLTEIRLDIAPDPRFVRFINLEKVHFTVPHAHYIQIDIRALNNLKNLKSLSILSAAQTYIDLAVIGQLNQLKELRLRSAYLEDGQFSMLSGLTNLEVLELPYLQKEIPTDDSQLDMSECIMPEIGNHNPVSGLRHLTKLVNLTYLDISYVQPTYGNDDPNPQEGYDIAHLVKKHFTKLKTINISTTKLGKDNREKLKAISWLTVIDVKDPYGLGGGDDDGEDVVQNENDME